MKKAIKVIVDPSSNLLRLSCGTCGDSIDLILEPNKETGEIEVILQDSIDLKLEEEPSEYFLTPIHLIV
jgi:hypothetical protein